MQAATAFALAVLAAVAAPALALPTADHAEAAAEALREEGVSVLPMVGHSEDAVNALPKAANSEDAVNALPKAANSEDVVKALPKAANSEDAVNALPKAANSEDATNVLPKAANSEGAVHALPKAANSEDAVNALPKTANSEDTVNALPKAANSEDAVNALLKAANFEDAVNALFKAANSEDAVKALPKAANSEDAVNALPKVGLAEVSNKTLNTEGLAEDAVEQALPADNEAADVTHPEDADNATTEHSPAVEAVAVACSRDDPSELLNDCIKTNLKALAPLMNEGGKRVGLPSLEPYFVPEVPVDYEGLIMDLHGVMTKVNVTGFMNLTVVDVRASLKDDAMDLEVDVVLPLVVFRGNFSLTTGFFSNVYEYNGEGPFHITMKNVTATWTFQGKREHGSEHMTIVKASAEYSVGGMKVGFKNFLGDHPFLEFVSMILANVLWDDVLSAGKPTVQGQLSEHLRVLSNAVFQHLPYDTMFPPRKSEPMIVEVVYRSGMFV